MFLSEWREFPSAPCLAGWGGNLVTARVSMLLKSGPSLTCFRACFLPGRAKDLSAPRYGRNTLVYAHAISRNHPTCQISLGSLMLLAPGGGEFEVLILLYCDLCQLVLRRTERLLCHTR